VNVGNQLELGREAFRARRWSAATEALGAADEERPLEASDLELLATALFMVGREDEHLVALERAHQRHLDTDSLRAAAACAFWLGMQLFMGGQLSRGGGWLARANRLIEQDGSDCVERGYLMMPEAYRAEAAGDLDAAHRTAAAAAGVARRFGDPDLLALATLAEGRFLVVGGRVREGLERLDEAILGVTSGAVSPRASGIVYCGAIDGCRTAFDPRRAREWTDALYAWCETQPELLAFTGDCHLHRGELLGLQGSWTQALAELERAGQRARRAGNVRVAAGAAYYRGDIHRLRGEFETAERAYRDAANGGYEPQPGLALLRAAQGDSAAAVATMRRLHDDSADPADRARLLPAYIEVMIGADDLDAAQEACDELDTIVADRPSAQLTAAAAHARGAVTLAAGDPRAAHLPLRKAVGAWHDLDAPLEAAQARLLLADAYSALGDEDSAQVELQAARETFNALGVLPQIEAARDMHGLTARELEVLRLVAAGRTNKAIAEDLVLSERTVDRHVSNILAKLRVSSRAAATAYAYEHRLI
jgi:ATP/maltotriose-dependent transcriptional regulator MalT